MTAADILFNIIVFLLSFFIMVGQKENLMEKLVSMLPIDSARRKDLLNSASKSIRGTFTCSFKVSANHTILTWIIIDMFKLDFALISAFIAGFFSLIPLFNPLFVVIPYCITYYIKQEIINCILLSVIIFI